MGSTITRVAQARISTHLHVVASRERVPIRDGANSLKKYFKYGVVHDSFVVIHHEMYNWNNMYVTNNITHNIKEHLILTWNNNHQKQFLISKIWRAFLDLKNKNVILFGIWSLYLTTRQSMGLQNIIYLFGYTKQSETDILSAFDFFNK